MKITIYETIEIGHLEEEDLKDYIYDIVSDSLPLVRDIGAKIIMEISCATVIKSRRDTMKYLSDRYRKITTYDGLDICTLKSVIPSQGDELGYKIDDSRFFGAVFECVEDAMGAIESLILI